MAKVWGFIKANFFFLIGGMYLLAALGHLSEPDYLKSLESLGLGLILLVAGFMDRAGKKAAEVLTEQSEKLRLEVEKVKVMAKNLVPSKEKKEDGSKSEDAPVEK